MVGTGGIADNLEKVVILLSMVQGVWDGNC